MLTWILYVCVYTPLKKITPLNTAVGAVAGALPIAIGWLAADGPQQLLAGDISATLAVAALGTVLYLWQFPHFMAIAWLYRKQYGLAGLKMLTVTDPSGLRAAGQSLAASLANDSCELGNSSTKRQYSDVSHCSNCIYRLCARFRKLCFATRRSVCSYSSLYFTGCTFDSYDVCSSF